MICITFFLSFRDKIVYNIYMLTPRNITELKSDVRDYLVKNPDMRNTIRILSDTEGAESPDLFGWVRLWLATKYQQGAEIDMSDLFGWWIDNES